MNDPVEHFFNRLPIAAGIGSLAGIAVTRLAGMKAIGLLGSRFNTGFHADYVGQYVGAAAGVAVLYAMDRLK